MFPAGTLTNKYGTGIYILTYKRTDQVNQTNEWSIDERDLQNMSFLSFFSDFELMLCILAGQSVNWL